MTTKHDVVLTPAAAMTAKRMYEEKDSRGRRIHSMASIARFLVCSETTIYRVLHELGPYKALPEHKNDTTMDQEAKESQLRFFRNNPDIAKAAGATVDAVDKMAQDIAKAKEKNTRGDRLLEELEAQPPSQGAYGKEQK